MLEISKGKGKEAQGKGIGACQNENRVGTGQKQINWGDDHGDPRSIAQQHQSQLQSETSWQIKLTWEVVQLN